MVFDSELGKQHATTLFISSYCLDGESHLKPGVMQSTKTLPDLCLADHNSSTFIHYLKHPTEIFLRTIHEAMLFRRRLKSQNLIFLNSVYSPIIHFLFTIPTQ